MRFKLRSAVLAVGPLLVVGVGVAWIAISLWLLRRLTGRPLWGVLATSEGCPDCRAIYWPHGQTYETLAFVLPIAFVVISLLVYSAWAGMAERRAGGQWWWRTGLRLSYAILVFVPFLYGVSFVWMLALGTFI